MSDIHRTLLIAVLATSLAAISGCGPGQSPQGQPPMVTLDGSAMDEMQRQFNDAADHTRVILLLSPT